MSGYSGDKWHDSSTCTDKKNRLFKKKYLEISSIGNFVIPISLMTPVVDVLFQKTSYEFNAIQANNALKIDASKKITFEVRKRIELN